MQLLKKFSAIMIILLLSAKVFGRPGVSMEQNNVIDVRGSTKERTLYLRAATPIIAFFGFDNGLEFHNYSAWGGATVGADYYYSPRSFVAISGGLTGAPRFDPNLEAKYNDTVKNDAAVSIKLTHNHDIDFLSTKKTSLSFGYGLSYSYFAYEEIAQATPEDDPIKYYEVRFANLGACVYGSIYLGRFMYVGLSFYPSLYSITRQEFEFTYLTYVDMGLRFPLRFKKKKEVTPSTFTPRF